ncbi:MAG: hypothetical protein AAF533_16790 [Acidobacteriota bacterium]
MSDSPETQAPSSGGDNVRLVLKVLLVMAGLAVVGAVGIGLLVMSALKDPCWANIDRHEVSVGIDIPKLGPDYHCSCQGQVKVSFFDIDSSDPGFRQRYGDIASYAQQYGFTSTSLADLPQRRGRDQFPAHLQDPPAGAQLLMKSGRNEKRSYLLILDQSTGSLWTELIGHETN